MQHSSSNSAPQLLNRLRMRQVALLLAVHEKRTLRAAADFLGMTQSAASQMLKELEETLGEALFDRVGRGLQLNSAGRIVLDSFRNLRNNMVALGHELNELRQGSAGKLTVGSIMVAIPTHLCHALAEMKRRYPLLSIEVQVDTSDRLVELLRHGALDIAIARTSKIGGRAEPDCSFHPIAGEAIRMVVATSHPLLHVRRKQLAMADMLAYPWILQPRGSPSREMIEQELLAAHASPPLGLIETTSILIAVHMLAFENMIAAFPESIALHYQQHDMLRILPYAFKHSLSEWGYIVHRDRSVSSTMHELIRLLAPSSP